MMTSAGMVPAADQPAPETLMISLRAMLSHYLPGVSRTTASGQTRPSTTLPEPWFTVQGAWWEPSNPAQQVSGSLPGIRT
jgi:hypothetical protein